MRHLAALGISLLAACGAEPPAVEQVPGAPTVADYIVGGDWPRRDRDPAGTRYSPLRQINTTNVDELRQAWSYPLGATASGAELTPLVIGGVLFASLADRVVALRAHNGEEIWRHLLVEGVPSRRGVAYWPGNAATAGRIFVTAGRALVALDAATGLPVAAFGGGGRVEMPVIYNAAPTVFEDLLIVGSQSPPGGVYAFSVETGERVWAFAASDAEGGGALAPAFSFAVDVDRALVYAPFAGPTDDPFYGGARRGGDALANSVVALEARTGRERWRFQTVHHDIWDYDLLAPPVLLDAASGGARVPTLALGGRTGYLYLLNRVTGEPVFGMTEVPVPASDVPDERSAVTQPIPVKPPPLARVSFVAEDLVRATDTTAEHASACRELRDRSGGFKNLGPFTPYGYAARGAPPSSTVVFPGVAGGIGWGGLAADPRAGLVFVNTTSDGGLGWLEPNDADPTAAQTGLGARRARLPYRLGSAHPDGSLRLAASAAGAAESWPCQRPPWGELSAVSVLTGEVVWRVPLGITERLPAERQRTGRENAGGAIATAAGLLFVGATTDRRFRAFDASTGEELWATTLPVSAHAVPVTYLGDDGKQYVAIAAAGGGGLGEPTTSDAQSLIAYALP